MLKVWGHEKKKAKKLGFELNLLSGWGDSIVVKK